MIIRRSITAKFLLSAILLLLVIFPLGNMFLNMTRANVAEIIHAPQFRESLVRSIGVAGAATIVSIIIAYVFALCVVRTNMRFREVFAVFVTLPMLIPSISHGMGLVFLLGANGIFSRILGLRYSIYGFSGIVLGSVFYALPVAFLMLSDILKYEDGTPYEVAEILGIPKINKFFSIALPHLGKPLISVVFAVFTLVFTDYGVALMIGGRFTTLPVLMYQEVIGLLKFNNGSVIGTFLLIPAIIAFLFDLFNRESINHNFVIQQKTKQENKIRDEIAFLYCLLICFIIILPIGMFVLLSFVRSYPNNMIFSFVNITKVLNMKVGWYLINSFIIAVSVSSIGTILSYITAYFTSRTQGKSSLILHLISLASLAIPGLALGLSYALFFNSFFFYGTISMLVMVNIAHFWASPYLLAYNSLRQLNVNLENVGLTLGVNRIYIIRDVLIPQTKSTIVEMFSYFFVNSMITISAVSFLSSVRNKPVSLMITQFEASFFLEGAAFVSLSILMCNFIAKCGVYFFKRYIHKEW